MTHADFCTCLDHECKLHPVNHDAGCAPCVAKNLEAKKIPSCFFRRIEPDASRKQDYSFEGFARFVKERRLA